MEPGGLLRSEYKGAIHDLTRNAMLVAQMSKPTHCSSVLRSTRLPVRAPTEKEDH